MQPYPLVIKKKCISFQTDLWKVGLSSVIIYLLRVIRRRNNKIMGENPGNNRSYFKICDQMVLRRPYFTHNISIQTAIENEQRPIFLKFFYAHNHVSISVI